MNDIERAAEVLGRVGRLYIDNDHDHDYRRAQALIDAGWHDGPKTCPHVVPADEGTSYCTLNGTLSDADRAVLDAADAWERADMKSWETYAPTVDALIAAVRARREQP